MLGFVRKGGNIDMYVASYNVSRSVRRIQEEIQMRVLSHIFFLSIRELRRIFWKARLFSISNVLFVLLGLIHTNYYVRTIQSVTDDWIVVTHPPIEREPLIGRYDMLEKNIIHIRNK